MNEFKKEYKNLKESINSENTNIISFLILGILLGRLVEKYKNIRKKIKRK
tara:strand:- start:1616 stop:1765 length:150 start_codon:yes stop_codon:yes gene_type:complete